MAGCQSKLTGEAHSIRLSQIYGSLSIILQRANALAILRRQPDSVSLVPSSRDQARFALERSQAAVQSEGFYDS